MTGCGTMPSSCQTTADWVKSLDYKDLVEVCHREGVPVDLIYSIEDIFNDEHYAARHDIVEVPDEEFGTMKMPAVHPILSKTPGEIKWAGPKLGSYNGEVYKKLLGYSDEELEKIKGAGASSKRLERAGGYTPLYGRQNQERKTGGRIFRRMFSPLGFARFPPL